MRRRCYENEVTGFFWSSEAGDELVPLVSSATAFTTVRASVRLVDNYEFRTSAKEISAAPVAFYEVNGYDYERVNIEK